MENGFSLQTIITDVLQNLLASVANLVPRLLTAIVVIIVGIIIAKIIARVVRTAFAKLRIDDLLDRVGLTDNLKRLGLRRPPGEILASIIYFLLVLLFVQSATQAVGMTSISDAIGSLFAYFPNLISALLVLLIGMTVAQFAGQAVERAALESGIEWGKLLGRLVNALIFFVIIIMSLSQLQIDVEIVRSVVLVLLAGLAIALALSFGLGSRDVTRNMMAGFYARKSFAPGDHVQIGEVGGTLSAITPIQTFVENGDDVIAIPNRVFLDEVIKR
jgi:small-conductance mechanosensitive channel